MLFKQNIFEFVGCEIHVALYQFHKGVLQLYRCWSRINLFCKHETKDKRCYTENGVIFMLEFLIDDIFVEFGGHNLQQIIGIPMSTNCVPLLAKLFQYSNEAPFYTNTYQIQRKYRSESRLSHYQVY